MFESANLIEQQIEVVFNWLTRPPDYSFLIYYAIAIGVAFVLYVFTKFFYEHITPPSMFLFGAYEKKNRNILAAYNYIWAGVIIAGIIVPLLMAIIT